MTSGARPSRTRESFDAVADDYERYRPSPPTPVVEALVTMCDLHRGDAVLEIGCGTGQLSVPLAEHGVDLTALELGPHLAALARRKLDRYPHARVEVTSFEAWPLPARTFDILVCASAFHWLDPDIRIRKSAEALGPRGSLAILHVHHVRGGTPGFFEDTQPAYVTWGLSDDPFFQPSTAGDAPTLYPELELSPEFATVERRRLEVPMQYSTASYVGWLRTDSLVNSLSRSAWNGFLQDIAVLIETRYGGAVARNFVYDVIVARRPA